MFSMTSLLLVLLLSVTVTALGGLGTLALHTAGTATTVGRLEREVDVLLGVETDDERRNVDDLLADTDVTLADEDTGVVDRLGKSKLEDLGLETTLKEVLGLEGKNVVETHAVVVEHTNAHKTADKGVTLEKTLGVLVVELEELTSSTTDLGEGKLNAPDLALVAKTVLAGELELAEFTQTRVWARDTQSTTVGHEMGHGTDLAQQIRQQMQLHAERYCARLRATTSSTLSLVLCCLLSLSHCTSSIHQKVSAQICPTMPMCTQLLRRSLPNQSSP